MAASMQHMDGKELNVYFPVRSGASLVKSRPVFSPDNKCLFVCSGSVVKVYSISGGDCIQELIGHRDYVTSIAIHPKNKLQLVSCSLDQTIIIWDYNDGILLRKLHQDSKLHALYTVDNDNRLFLLKQNLQLKTVCDLVAVSISKHAPTEKTTNLLSGCSMDCRKTTVCQKGSYCATVKGRELRVRNMSKQQLIRHMVDAGQEITCVVSHPGGHCLATGCKDGKILVWYKFLEEDKAVTTVFHWHALPVIDLCYTLEGSYLLSGGFECVLVKWHHDSKFKDFMPRLGAPLNHIACSSDNLLYATCHDDNVIQVMTSSFSLERVYQGLTRGYLKDRTIDPFPAGLTVDPRTGSLVLNGKPGHIQFYSVHEDKQLFNLDIVCHNYISPENLENPLTVTEVIKADFDSQGAWLATVEYWSDGVMTPELRLKFWQFKEEKQSFILNTTIEMPHEERVGTLKFRPQCNSASPGTEHMAVTSSSDGKFKVWMLVDDTDIYRSNEKWTCESVGFYRDLPAGETAFSEDGSLLAVVYGPCVTLWNPENNNLKQTLQNPVAQDPVRHVMFGNHGCSHFLLSSTDSMLTAWSLISCTVVWRADTRLVCLAKDPYTDLVAAFTHTADLFVFKPSDPSPVFSHAGVSDSAVLSSAFVPHSKKSQYENTTMSWQSHSELYFMNRDQELLAVSFDNATPSPKLKEDLVSFERNLPQSALSMLMSRHSNRSGVRSAGNEVDQQPDGKFIKEIFRSASHVQPSVTTLCRPFILSLMIPSKTSRKKRDSDSEDEDLSEEEVMSQMYQTVSQDSGLDSDMEVDEPANQSVVSKKSSQSQTDSDSDTSVSRHSKSKIKKNKRNMENEKISDVCHKLEHVKVVERTVDEAQLDQIFKSKLNWYTTALESL